ncbi:MAG: methyltransferase domain-containing protein, partial [Acidobacteria bacterium]|nr:methyltransferase domain-containing protein [Acidobacteriota bacterium]
HPPLIGDDDRVRLIRRTIDRWSGSAAGRGGLRAVDLGCLEGGLSLEMARCGMEVLGVEGREENFRRCQLVEEYFGLPKLSFLQLDVRQLTPSEHGTFDVILCCGLLYHLDDPFSFLDRMAALCRPGGLLFLDTHIAPPDERSLDDGRFADKLSPLESYCTDRGTFEGRWFEEFTGPKGEAEPWAAVGNPRSFWPTEDALLRALGASGFRDIFKVFGVVDIDRELALRREFSRGYFVAIGGGSG